MKNVKKLLLLIVTMMTVSMAYAQTDRTVRNEVVEVPATYPGGDNALLRDVANNLVYPASALNENVQGVVLLKFQVKRNGSIGKITVEKSLTEDCDKAAIAAVRKLKRFIPAKQDGKSIPIWFRLPIRFRIQ